MLTHEDSPQPASAMLLRVVFIYTGDFYVSILTQRFSLMSSQLVSLRESTINLSRSRAGSQSLMDLPTESFSIPSRTQRCRWVEIFFRKWMKRNSVVFCRLPHAKTVRNTQKPRPGSRMGFGGFWVVFMCALDVIRWASMRGVTANLKKLRNLFVC